MPQADPAEEALFSVVIPSRDRVEHLRQCVEALLASDAPEVIGEIIVVDDGSVDGTVEFLQSLQGKSQVPVRVLRNHPSRGPAVARNRGIQAATSPHVWMLDDDVVVEPHAAGAYACHYREHDMHMASSTGPVVQQPHGMTPFEYWSFNGGSQFIHCRIRSDQVLDAGDEHFCTANLVSPTALLQQHRFNETFVHARYEDRELGYRLAKDTAHKIHYIPNAAATHVKRLSFRAWLQRFDIVAACALHFASLHPDDDRLRDILGMRRAERMQSFRLEALDEAVATVNRWHETFFRLEGDVCEEWVRQVVFASFRMLQEFFRINAYRAAMHLPQLRDEGGCEIAGDAMRRILGALREDA